VTSDEPYVEGFVGRIQKGLRLAKQCLQAAQDRMRALENKSRREVSYAKDDMVWLSTANMKPKQGVKKFMPRWIGPFEVLEMVGKAAVKLHMSEGYGRLHNVFHVSLLKPFVPRAGEARWIKAPLPLEWADGQPVYEVDAILNHQGRPLTTGKGKRKKVVPGKEKITAYQVKWRGQEGVGSTSWEAVAQLDGCQELIATYKASRGLE